MSKKLNLPKYWAQLLNPRHPYGTCNVSSVAIVMSYLGIVGDGSEGGNLPMQILRWMDKNGLRRHVHDHLVKAFAWKGIKDKFTTEGTIEDIKKSIDLGKPVIFSGDFSASGHIVVIYGYITNESGEITAFNVSDPYGSFQYKKPSSKGFRHSYVTKPIGIGEHQVYSLKAILDVAKGRKDGTLWLHILQ